jgi:hypothetical protein
MESKRTCNVTQVWLSCKPAPGAAGQGRPWGRGREAIGGLHQRRTTACLPFPGSGLHRGRGRPPVREARAGSDSWNLRGWKRDRRGEARAADDDGKVTTQQGPSDRERPGRAARSIRLAAPFDSRTRACSCCFSELYPLHERRGSAGGRERCRVRAAVSRTGDTAIQGGVFYMSAIKKVHNCTQVIKKVSRTHVPLLSTSLSEKSFRPCAVGFQPFGSSYRWDRTLKWTILPLAFREEVETMLVPN